MTPTTDRFRNQAELINENKLSTTRFVVVGAGALGSATTVLLSKMGARNITVYDFDNLEDHNFANQLYPISSRDRPKVEALQTVAKDYGDCTIKPVNAPWTPDNAADCDVLFSCVDNMDVRANLYNYYKQKNRCKLFVDGRMSGRIGSVFGISCSYDSKSVKEKQRYKKSLFPQSMAHKERCGQKSIIYTVMVLSGLMVNQVDLWLNNEHRPSEIIMDLFNGQVTFEYDKVRSVEIIDSEDMSNESIKGPRIAQVELLSK